MERRQRNLVVVAGSIVALVIIIGVVSILLRKPIAKSIYDANGKLTYTDAITRAQSSDIPGESPYQLAPPVTLPSANIDGIDVLSTYLTNDQAIYAVNWLTSYLEARSQQLYISGGIKQGSFSQSNDKLVFTIITLEPQATYSVTITNTSALVMPNIKVSRESL